MGGSGERSDDAGRLLSSDYIAWDHVIWFRGVLNDPQRLLLVGEVDQVPVGTVRFVDDGGAGGVDRRRAGSTGRRLARRLLAAAFAELVADRVVALVRPENLQSLRVFPRAMTVVRVSSAA